MFKFLRDIKELQVDVKEIFDEFNKEFVTVDTWFSFKKRRTLTKRVMDLENIIDALVGHLGLDGTEIAAVPETIVPGVPAKWVFTPKEKVVVTKTKKGKK